MNRKFMVNAAVATLMALGLAACSSGGSSTTAVKPQHDAKKQNPHHGHKAPSTGKEVKNVYGAVVAFNDHDGKRVLDTAASQVKYSDAHELKIGQKKVVLHDRYSFDFMMENGWKYQAVSKYNPVGAKDDRKASFVTLGYQTPAKDIPQSGEATYKGKAYIASVIDRHPHLQGTASADVTVGVDFKAKTVAFKTENTLLNNKKTDSLNLTGSAKLDVAKNQFVDGTVKMGANGRGYPGTLEGHLYGPKAEEVGGTFNISGQFIGGFGAKK